MGHTWTPVVCVVALSLSCVSAQAPNRTWFLVSGPEVLHAGTPASLAVSVSPGFSGRVVAEIKHMDVSVSRTEDIQGGVTRLLTLPPIPGSASQSSPVNLTVSGYSGDTVVFRDSTTLSFSPMNVSTFIHMDKPVFHPGDTIRVRVVSVRLDNRPYEGVVHVSVQDPMGSVVDRWESTGSVGIVLQEFSLTQTAPVGQWAFMTAVNGVTNERRFTVEHHAERPAFEVLVKAPSRLLAGDDITGSIRALYPSGQPVRGTLTVSVPLDGAAPGGEVTQSQQIYGSTQFFIARERLQLLAPEGDARLRVSVCVNSDLTGTKVNKTVEVHIMKSKYQLRFHSSTSLKPTLNFYTRLRITRFDRKPLTAEDQTPVVVFRVNQTVSATQTSEMSAVTSSVPEDGDVHIKLPLQAGVDMLSIRATFESSEETLDIVDRHSSSGSSHVQITPVSGSPAQVGSPLVMEVESNFDPAHLHFVVSSRGQVLAAGTTNSSSFSLTPSLTWFPEVCVTVYCLLPDGEAASDTARVTVGQSNRVSLSWSSEEAQPGEQVSLTVAAADPGSRAAIVVMATHEDDDTPMDELAKLGFPLQWCHVWMKTNTKLKVQEVYGPENDGDLLVEKYWTHWMETSESLLWLDTTISGPAWTSGKITVPDGVASLGAVAMVMSANLGLGFSPVPVELSVSKDFSLFLNVPLYLIRGEEIVLEVHIISHLQHQLEVMVLLAQGSGFEFAVGEDGDVLVSNAQKLVLDSHVSASAWFPIRPVALGDIEITVDAVSASASDSLVWTVHVKPEGIEQTHSQTLFLEPARESYNNSSSTFFSFPLDVVPGSQRAHVALGGDVLAMSFGDLSSLVQLPLGCGEQNMIHFAPSVYVLQYLDMSTLDDVEIRGKAQHYMREGYRKQLSFRRDDGSFSAFGKSDASGSTWLTAFVLRCFLQAGAYIQIDEEVLSGAVTWLLQHQGPRGQFREVGRLIHTEMQGGLDNESLALTAYVLSALLEDDDYAVKYADNISLAISHLESHVTSEWVSNYSLCLVTYALTLANRPQAAAALERLKRRADTTNGIMMWRTSAGVTTPEQEPFAAQIEMASYVLLTLFKRGGLEEGVELHKWLCKQRNHLGGYSTTQDTVVALQALSYFAAFSGANAIDLRLSISTPSVSHFTINSTNYRQYQSQEISADQDVHVNIDMVGRGFATFQMNAFYNVRSSAFSQSGAHTHHQEGLSLNVAVSEDSGHNHLHLSVCMKLKDAQAISQTGMVILDVGVLSGFRLLPGAVNLTSLIRRVETHPERTILYLDSLTTSEVCITLPFIRAHKVARVQDAAVQLYCYYEPKRRTVVTYNSDFLHKTGSCFFCGSECELCRPGVTVSVSSQLLSDSVDSVGYSLSFILLGVFVISVL